MGVSNVAKGGVAAGGIAGVIALIAASVVDVEGGDVNHPDDPGGKTRFGITEESYRACGFKGKLATLTRDQAIDCYARLYIVKPGFDGVIARSVAVGQEVVDQGANLGTRRPSCYLQKALNSLNRGELDYPDLKVDCVVGQRTVGAFAALEAKRGNRKACELVLKLMDAQQGAEYLRLVEQTNPKLESFMVGWTDTRLGNVPLDRCGEGGVA